MSKQSKIKHLAKWPTIQSKIRYYCVNKIIFLLIHTKSQHKILSKDSVFAKSGLYIPYTFGKCALHKIQNCINILKHKTV